MRLYTFGLWISILRMKKGEPKWYVQTWIVSRFVVSYSVQFSVNRRTKMEINDTTIPLIWFYQLYGFAPYKIVRNKVNQIIDFKRNRILCIYGVTMIIAFTFASNYALLYDFYSGHALRYFVHKSFSMMENRIQRNPSV